MTQSPEPIPADRMERLLRGGTPEGAREAHLAGVVRELRAETPGASPELRERVRALPTSDSARAGLFWNRIASRRLALVLAPAALFAIGAGAAVYGLAQRDGQTSAVPTAVAFERQRAGGGDETSLSAQLDSRLNSKRGAVPSPLVSGDAIQPLPGGTRVRDVAAWLRLRVPNTDRLSDAANDAMRITRTLGGYVAYVDVNTAGKSGHATMTLRVPVGNVEDAIVRLSDLGTITGQHASIVDRQVEVDRLANRISSLRVAVARTRAAFTRAQTEEERARLQLLLERQRSLLNRLTRQRGGIVREASFARIDLTVVTGKAPKDSSVGPFGRAASDALHLLGVASAGAVFIVIVLSPLLLLAALVAVALRSRRRRIEERLLDRLGPAAGGAGEPAPGPLP